MPNYADNAPQGYHGDGSRGAPLGRGTKAPDSRTMKELEAEFISLSRLISDCLRLKEARPSRSYKAPYWREEAESLKMEREEIRALIKSHGERTAYAPKVTLQRIRLDSGGYDPQGAYWGLGAPLYWAATDDGKLDSTFRADGREGAKAHIRRTIPNARFFR